MVFLKSMESRISALQPSDPGNASPLANLQQELAQQHDSQVHILNYMASVDNHLLCLQSAASIPAQAPAPHPPPHLARPPRYSGDPKLCLGFLNQCQLHFELLPLHYPTDQAKVAFVVSHLEVFDEPGCLVSTTESLFNHQGTFSVGQYAIRFRTLSSELGWNNEALVGAFRNAPVKLSGRRDFPVYLRPYAVPSFATHICLRGLSTRTHADLPTHRWNVRLVLLRLRENRLYAKLEKCVLEQSSLPFLGYIISDSGLRMDPEKVSAMLNWPRTHGVKAYAFCCRQERERQQRRQRRRFWRHPIIELRASHGAYHTLYSELQENPDKFADYTRMSQESFLDLLGMVEGNIRRRDTQLRRAIPPEERLLVTLRFLATGESLSSLHFQYRLGISTLSGIVADTCRALWDVLCPEFLPLPTAEKWLQISDKFWAVCNFPNCLGAVDGKHIRITKPARSGSEYYNYKKYFSTVLMAIADADCRFVAVDIGAFGRGNDSQTFKNSDMGRRLYGNHFNFPLARPLPQTQTPPLPFVVVGDEAFQMCPNLLKPYSSRDLDHPKKIFNYRLTRGRRTVECAFGILVSRWRILSTAINLKMETVDEVVKACVVLHNFVMAKERPNFDMDEPAANPLPDFTQHPLQSSVEVAQMRDQFADFFLSDVGRVAWQD
ncbi:uncharacterized protein [Dendrobates tinctorius]|uniref:uncharacterized protein n=1 Tax=Dendrobates tinctorius TaxID=92724 RepID=UPI003CCA4A29